jgi:hypothetical protein
MRDQGMKKDHGKPRWELVPFEALEGMVRILEFGAEKYSAHGWKQLNSPEDRERIMAALLRHTFALMRGETIDPESGMPHIFHMQCNTMFLGYFEYKDQEAFSDADDAITIELPEPGTVLGTIMPGAAVFAGSFREPGRSAESHQVHREKCTCKTLGDINKCDKNCGQVAIIGGCE